METAILTKIEFPNDLYYNELKSVVDYLYEKGFRISSINWSDNGITLRSEEKLSINDLVAIGFYANEAVKNKIESDRKF